MCSCVCMYTDVISLEGIQKVLKRSWFMHYPFGLYAQTVCDPRFTCQIYTAGGRQVKKWLSLGEWNLFRNLRHTQSWIRYHEGAINRSFQIKMNLCTCKIQPYKLTRVLVNCKSWCSSLLHCQPGCKSNNSRKAVMGIIYTDIACMRGISMRELTVMSCSLSENKSSS